MSDTKFVLLHPSKADKSTISRARKCKVSEIISKPFKSGELFEIISKIINKDDGLSKVGGKIGLKLKNPLLSDCLNKVLENCKINKEIVSEESSADISKLGLSAIFTDVTQSSDLSWHSSSSMGQLFVIADENVDIDGENIPLHATVLFRPLEEQALLEQIKAYIDPSIAKTKDEKHPLELGEQSMLAAKISAAVYQRLLNYDALKNRKWDEACTAIGIEALRVCRDHEKED